MNAHPMKSLLSILMFLSVSLSNVGYLSADDDSRVIRLSEPVAETDTHEIFGSPLPAEGKSLSLGELISNSDDYQEQEVLLETRVAKVCQKKGCFFIAQEGEYLARVSFKDYGFFVPTDSGGKEVILLGTFSRQLVSQQEADHFARDLGEPDQSDPARFEYSIVASAIGIPKS